MAFSRSGLFSFTQAIGPSTVETTTLVTGPSPHTIIGSE